MVNSIKHSSINKRSEKWLCRILMNRGEISRHCGLSTHMFPKNWRSICEMFWLLLSFNNMNDVLGKKKSKKHPHPVLLLKNRSDLNDNWVSHTTVRVVFCPNNQEGQLKVSDVLLMAEGYQQELCPLSQGISHHPTQPLHFTSFPSIPFYFIFTCVCVWCTCMFA